MDSAVVTAMDITWERTIGSQDFLALGFNFPTDWPVFYLESFQGGGGGAREQD